MILEGMVLLLPGGVPPAPVYIEEETGGGERPAFGNGPAAIARGAPLEVSAGLIWPVAGSMWGGFGPRWGSFHKGIDIGAGYGTAVGAAASGQVVLATSGGGYGNYVIVRHGNGLETLYAHLSAIYVGLGQYVGQGEAIGAVGCTGRCSGNHLHFEVYVGGVPVDPLGYLP
jgi:murein DD-endopeptidase MepM/ murein hydrolase activator NlpD